MIGLVLALALVVEPDGLSMDAALERIRAARAAGETNVVRVMVKGVNRLEKSVVFTAEDHDIDFVGTDGAMLSGGIRLTGWKDLGDGVWETDAPKSAQGETAFFDQLWVDGRRAPCARVPNEGWIRISTASQMVAAADAPAKYIEHVVLADEAAKVLKEIPPEDYPFLTVGIVCKWTYGTRTLLSYDAKLNAIQMRTDFQWQPWKIWERGVTTVAFFNVRSGFDAPGEWFLDLKAGKVRYRPLPGEDPRKVDIEVPRQGVESVIVFAGDGRGKAKVRNIRFSNIVFAYGASGIVNNRHRPINQHQAAVESNGLISLEGVEGIVFDRCSMSHCAGYAMRWYSACTKGEVRSCRMTDLGAGGVLMGEREKPKGITRAIVKATRPEVVAFNVISNCVITGGGRYNLEGVGVCLTHCSDTKILHNDISDFYYSGVSIGWIWGFFGSASQRNEVGFNRIWDLGKGVMSDMGGVYTLSTSFGTTIHDNVIHDVKSFAYGGWALYCDEGSEGIVEERNLCWNTTDGGFHQHFGVGCVIRNNIFAFNRLLGAVRLSRDVVDDVPCSLHFVNNIVYVKEGPLVGEDVRKVGGVWANNLWYDVRGESAARFDGLTWDKWCESGRESGGVFADPKFADPENFDFTLKADSPALKLGFKPFDLSSAGARLP